MTPWCPDDLNSLNVQLQNVLLFTFWLCRSVSYTCQQTHSQNGARENDESRDRGLNCVTEKTTSVVARLQSVNTLWTGDTDLRLYITTLQDGWCKSAFLTRSLVSMHYTLNPLAPSDPYMGPTAQLTSRRCIWNTYSTNIHTEYFKCAA
jgi:hypothetical protein